MADLEVKAPEQFREVIEYVFTFNYGMELSFVVDEVEGDSYNDNGDNIYISLAPKTIPYNPEQKAPGEDIIINKATLAVTQVRKRNKRIPTPDEMFEFQKTLHREVRNIQ